MAKQSTQEIVDLIPFYFLKLWIFQIIYLFTVYVQMFLDCMSVPLV